MIVARDRGGARDRPRRRIGAALRLERRFDGSDLGAEALQHASIAGSRLSRSLRSSICTGTWRSPRCQASRASDGRSAARTSISGSGSATTSTSPPSSSTSASSVRSRTVSGKIELDAGALDAEQKALLRLALRMRQDERVDDGRSAPFGSMKNAGGARHVRSDRVARVPASVEPGRTLGVIRRLRRQRAGAATRCAARSAPQPSHPCAGTPDRRTSRAAGRRDRQTVPMDSTHHG